MLFVEDISQKIEEINSIYDLIAYCYCYLMDNIGNPIIFLGEYIDKNETLKRNNPNLERLDKFSMQIKYIMKQDSFTVFSSVSNFQRILDLIKTTEASLVEYGDKTLNYATIPYYMLQGLDLYFEDCDYETYKISPLNDYNKDGCFIYVNKNLSLMDDIIKNKTYPSIVHTNDIRFGFNHIIIMLKEELPKGYGIPKLITLSKQDEFINRIVENKKIKIAVIPVMRDKWFEFNIVGGSSFIVQYTDEEMIKVQEKVIALLKWAIESGANIIIFPEYTCKEEIQKEICKKLSEMAESYPEKMEELLFVISGSGWTSDSNNVSCLYSYDGYLLGRVYKYSAFDKNIKETKYMERLRNPGKEITLIKIPGIGICQTEICRNVSENKFSHKLAQVFNTQFLLIPAWSNSVNIAFKTPLNSIIAANHRTCAVVCNCCAAFEDEKDFKNKIGIIAVPQKNVSVVEGCFTYIERTKEVCDACCEYGCMFEVCFDFNGTHEKDIEVICEFRKRLEMQSGCVYNNG
ncbi:MAG: hypothetical protein HFJ08_03850 [Lachnospiraceae bacterium]|nr:hypothetical protein [Lachnospiraceae bacterium]